MLKNIRKNSRCARYAVATAVLFSSVSALAKPLNDGDTMPALVEKERRISYEDALGRLKEYKDMLDKNQKFQPSNVLEAREAQAAILERLNATKSRAPEHLVLKDSELKDLRKLMIWLNMDLTMGPIFEPSLKLLDELSPMKISVGGVNIIMPSVPIRIRPPGPSLVPEFKARELLIFSNEISSGVVPEVREASTELGLYLGQENTSDPANVGAQNKFLENFVSGQFYDLRGNTAKAKEYGNKLANALDTPGGRKRLERDLAERTTVDGFLTTLREGKIREAHALLDETGSDLAGPVGEAFVLRKVVEPKEGSIWLLGFDIPLKLEFKKCKAELKEWMNEMMQLKTFEMCAEEIGIIYRTLLVGYTEEQKLFTGTELRTQSAEEKIKFLYHRIGASTKGAFGIPSKKEEVGRELSYLTIEFEATVETDVARETEGIRPMGAQARLWLTPYLKTPAAGRVAQPKDPLLGIAFEGAGLRVGTSGERLGITFNVSWDMSESPLVTEPNLVKVFVFPNVSLIDNDFTKGVQVASIERAPGVTFTGGGETGVLIQTPNLSEEGEFRLKFEGAVGMDTLQTWLRSGIGVTAGKRGVLEGVAATVDVVYVPESPGPMKGAVLPTIKLEARF